MRTDDSFYQETYLNANVNGVRPYWKNVKVKKRCGRFLVLDEEQSKRKKRTRKTHARKIKIKKRTALL